MKRLVKIVGITLLALVAGFFFLVVFGQAAFSSVRGIYTRFGIQHLEGLRVEAVQGDLAQAAKSLKSATEYQPSKVPSTGDYGYIIETYRASVVREIISRMRDLSGEDLGDDPKEWIQKYDRGDNGRFNSTLHNEPPPAAAFPESSETMRIKPVSAETADGGDR